MFLKKIKFFDANVDEFKKSINKNLIRKNGKFIQNREQDTVTFKYLSPTYTSIETNYFTKTQTIETQRTEITEQLTSGNSFRSYIKSVINYLFGFRFFPIIHYNVNEFG